MYTPTAMALPQPSQCWFTCLNETLNREACLAPTTADPLESLFASSVAPFGPPANVTCVVP